MKFETIEMTVDQGVAVITLQRPDAANALNALMANELQEAAVRCDENENIRAVVITATGKMFCAGGDLQEFNDAGDGQYGLLIRVASALHTALIRFTHLDAPVIMAINGTAAGGGFSMALAGDFIIASDRAKFVAAYTASGLTPDGSSTYFLAKHVGLLRAKELLFTNRLLTAEEALDWGIVSKVVPDEQLMEEAMNLAKSFAEGPTKAFGGLKSLLHSTYSAPIEEQLERETQSIANMMHTHDAPAALQSFLNKEKPEFKGR